MYMKQFFYPCLRFVTKHVPNTGEEDKCKKKNHLSKTYKPKEMIYILEQRVL
jgi:hypothetical protein